MSFIGNVPAESYTTVVKDTFSGNDSTTDFTLSIPATTNSVEVFVENVQQEPTDAYTISGTTLSFTAAPVTGTDNIYVIHRGPAVQQVVPPAGTAIDASTVTASGDVSIADKIVHTGDTNTAIRFPAADTVTVETGGSERVRVDSSGNVGIGTSSPAGNIHSYSGASGATRDDSGDELILENNGNSGLSILTPNTDLGSIFFGDPQNAFAGFIQYDHGFPYMRFGTEGAEAMRIDSSGNLLVGRTSLGGNETLSLENSNNVSGDFSIVGRLGSNCNNTSSYHYIGSTGGSDKVYIHGNGNIVNVNNSYGSLSDIKIKENITDATPKLDNLNQVRVVNYNLKDNPDQKLLGVVAQELEEIFPGMVDESPDRDTDGNILDTTTKSVKYSVFVPMLIKAMQEQQEQINELKAEVAALKETP